MKLGRSASKIAFRRVLVRSVFVPITAMAVLAIALILQVNQLTASSALVEHTDNIIARLYRYEKTLVDLQAGIRGFLITADDAYLGPYFEGRDSIPELRDELRRLTADRALAQQHLLQIQKLTDQYLEYGRTRIDARRANDTATLSQYGVGNGIMNEIRSEFDTLIAEEIALRSDRNDATRNLAWWTKLGAAVVTLFVGALLSLLSRGQLRWLSQTYEAALMRSHELSESLERRVAERTREIESTNERLNEANKELEAFAYSVSHDLRAPMRHISGFANLLMSSTDSKLLPEDLENLETIHRTAVLAGRMVDDLLAFSRIGRSQIRSDLVDLDLLVELCRRELAPELAGRKIEWGVPPLLPTQGDTNLLKLVIQNLLSNAVKYTNGRAVAHIEVGSRAEAGGGTTYWVKDNGVGFDMAYAHKLFGVFQRLHRAEEFEGTGIGLANVRRIITRHGGRTWAEGQPGVGATFYFHLPGTPTIANVPSETPR